MTVANPSFPMTGSATAYDVGTRSTLPRHAQKEPGIINVGGAERSVSVGAGAVLALLGLGRRDLLGLAIAGVGGAMIHRGVTGRCPATRALGIDTAHKEGQLNGTRFGYSFLIHKPAEELYAFWRNFENLPSIMDHLQSVTVKDSTHSHWVTKAPSLIGGAVEWDAEITHDEPGRRIDWRSLENANVDQTGSIQFSPAMGDRGTMVHVILNYIAPAGPLGKWISALFGETPEGQLKEGLRSFKRLMETGEVITIHGQPRGTCLTGGGKREAGGP